MLLLLLALSIWPAVAFGRILRALCIPQRNAMAAVVNAVAGGAWDWNKGSCHGCVVGGRAVAVVDKHCAVTGICC